MEFLVLDPSEEYFIIKRLCCPKCSSPKKKLAIQRLMVCPALPQTLKEVEASGEYDEITLKCLACGYEYTLTFHLHKSYIEELRKLREKPSE